MLNFLKSVWNLFTGGVSDVWHWILSAFSQIWTYVYQMWDVLAGDFTEALYYTKELFDELSTWVVHTVDNVASLIDKTAADVEHWASGLIGKVESYAEDVYHWAIQSFDYIEKLITTAYDDIQNWVMSSIWDPLYNFVRSALDWIENEGAQMWDLLTHPEQMVSLLESYLYSAWLTWLQRLAVPITGYILRNAIQFAPDLVSLAEDVISKVL